MQWCAGVSRRCGNDSGVSLVEMLVSMVVASVLLAGVATMAVTGLRATDGANQRNEAVSQMRTATDRLTKQLRTADSLDGTSPGIIVAEPQRIGFYAKLGTLDLTAADAGSQVQVPSVVWLWSRVAADGRTDLCQQVYRGTVVGATVTFPADATSATAARTCMVVARRLDPSAGRPLFTYLRTTDDSFAADGRSISTIGLNAQNAVPAASLTDIASVEIWMKPKMQTQNPGNVRSTVARVTFINLISRSS